MEPRGRIIIIMSNLTDEERHITCTDDLNNMHITCTAAKDVVDVCVNCGKEGNDLNICNKCQMVLYCNAACKKKHRSKHKKKCERRVAELHNEALFNQPPPREDCPICFLRLPCFIRGINIIIVVEKRYAVGVFMQLH